MSFLSRFYFNFYYLNKFTSIIQNGGTAVDAVETAIRVLEESEYFSAGRGSLLNTKGQVECDAMIMDGNTLNYGRITALTLL